jgi:hypothetical protein
MANRNPLSEVTSLLGGGVPSSSTPGGSALTQQITTITQQLQQLQSINQAQVTTLEANTQAVDQNTSTKGSGGESTASKVGSALENVFGLGLSPLISGLVSLFGGGGGSSQPAPLVPYVAPPAIHLNAGVSSRYDAGSASPFAVDDAYGGLPRPVPTASTQPTQITVQVQAMDSKSFLDHSDDIAMAVRQAMLTSSTLSDVIREVS